MKSADKATASEAELPIPAPKIEMEILNMYVMCRKVQKLIRTTVDDSNTFFCQV